MIRRPISRAATIGLGVASVLLLLVAYTWLSHRQHRLNPSDTTIPTWRQLGQGVTRAFVVNERSQDRRVVGDAKTTLRLKIRKIIDAITPSQDRWVVADATATGFRLFAGLGYGVLGAIILGMAMGCFTPVEAFAYPLLSLLAKVPPTAALAVFFVLVGTGTNMYVAMIGFGILPTLAMTVFLAVKEFPEELQFKAYTLGASHLEVITSIIFRCVLPRLIDSIRLVIGPAMVFLIAAEMLVGDVGFGYRIRLQSKLVNMNVVYPYLALLASFGYTMDFALKALQRRLCPWYETQRH